MRCVHDAMYHLASSNDNIHIIIIVISSESVAIDSPVVKGYEFNAGIDYPALLKSFFTTVCTSLFWRCYCHHCNGTYITSFKGYQATSFGQAIEEINRMVRCSAFSADITYCILLLSLMLDYVSHCCEKNIGMQLHCLLIVLWATFSTF